MKRIVLAEDHALVRDGLKLLLMTRPSWQVVAETGDGRLVERIVRDSQADLLLLDLDLPGCHGIDLAKRIKVECPGTSILVLTGNPHVGSVKSALAAGADGYMIKHEDAGELLHAISLVLSGIRYVSSGLAEVLEADHGRVTAPITTREREILALIANGYSSQEIAGKLNVSVLTVRKHRQNLMSKLSLHSIAQVTAYAIRCGLAGEGLGSGEENSP